MTAWIVIAVLAVITFALKAAGPVMLGGRRLPPRLEPLAPLLPAALLAALVCVQTFGDGEQLTVDARAVGLAAAAIALWRKAGFLTTVLVAMAATAAVRAIPI
jgi:branched-subunit amino acid transport protein